MISHFSVHFSSQIPSHYPFLGPFLASFKKNWSCPPLFALAMGIVLDFALVVALVHALVLAGEGNGAVLPARRGRPGRQTRPAAREGG